jgi:hypothetical protein
MFAIAGPICRQFLLVLFVGQISSLLLPKSASAGCSPDNWRPAVEAGGSGIQALLKDISLTTRWSDLPDTIKAQLQSQADKRLTGFRGRWAADALAAKETILLDCPTPAAAAALDDYYRKSYNTVVPSTFSLATIKNPELKRALIRGYLGAVAAFRAGITYPDQKLPNRDWDGVSIFDSVRLPDRQTYQDIRRYGASVVADLKEINQEALDDNESRLQQRALFDARAIAVGAFSRDSKGGSDMESACEIVALNGDVLAGYRADRGRPRIFANDDEVLREVNAIYLNNTSLKWLDVGTLQSALKFGLCNGTEGDVEQYVGDPKTNEVAKALILLKSWWIERVTAGAAAQNKCTVYSAPERTQIWEGFSADQELNNGGSSSMESYRSQLQAYRGSKLAQYRPLAKLALQKVFPDNSILTDPQRAQVLAAIEAETAFGRFQDRIAAALDAAQGSPGSSASTRWQAALKDNVARLGGYAEGERVRPDDEAAIRAMFGEVKSWVSKRYRGYPIEIGWFIDTIQFTVNTTNNAETRTANGAISFGLGTQRSKMEYYSLLIHELRHAVAGAWKIVAPDKSNVVLDEGTAVEGSGVAAEELLLGIFLRETLNNDLAYTLYSLDYGIRDARFTATTDATLQRYFREGCSGASDPNTIDFAKSIAVSYGLTGVLADNLALRSHAGTQYFQYISAGVQIVDDISYLQSQVDPAGTHPIDPYVLFACGLNTPKRTAPYVAALKRCLKL